MNSAVADELPVLKVGRRLIAMTRPVLGQLIFSGIARILGQCAVIAIYALGGYALGQQLTGSPMDWKQLAAALVGLSLLRGLFSYIELFFAHLVAFRALELLRIQFFAALGQQAPLDARRRRSGDLLTIATKDISRIEVFFAHTLAPLVSALVVPVLVAIAASWVNPWLGGWLLLSSISCLIVPLLGWPSDARAGREITAVRSGITTYLIDTVQSARDILGYQHARRRIAQLAPHEERLRAGLLRGGRVDALRQAFTTSIPLCTGIAITVAGASLYTSGQVHLPGLLAVLAAAIPAHVPTTAVTEFVAGLKLSIAAARRMLAAMDAPPTIPVSVEPKALPKSALTLELRGVTVSYPGALSGGPVIADIDLRVAPGELVGLVGPSGSGKSTLVAVVPRLLDPSDGVVTLDGIALPDLDVNELRSRVCYVPQRDYLFDGSLRENLLLALPAATDEQLLAACRLAGLTNAAGELELSAGLDTMLTERGTQVSGGQRQRIGVARGFLRTATLGCGQAEILVLDEATSDLDAAAQQIVTDSVAEHVSRGGSALVVAHRLSTVAAASKIVVIGAGRIEQTGTHAELLARGGSYAQMYRAQSVAGRT